MRGGNGHSHHRRAQQHARPGGFDNPDGSQTPEFAKRIGATKFALQSLAITVVLAALGFYFQFK